MCDFCARHGGGKKWYENEANFSRKLFAEQETQEFLHDYFAGSVEKSKQTFEENMQAASNPALKQIVEPRLQDKYVNYLHHQIVPTEVAEQIVKIANRACRFSCICRKRYGDCTKYCIGLGFVPDVAAKYPNYTTGIEEMNVEEAAEYIRKLDEERIVHAVSALRVPYVGMICNCDLRVCSPYRYRAMLGVESAMYKSEYVFSIDLDECNQCGKCQARCLFGAIELVKGACSINEEKCFGCGMCRTVCDAKAINLALRANTGIKNMW